MLSSKEMELSEVYRGLGRERFGDLLRCVSMGGLKTFQVYESFKIRTRLSKLNRDRLRKAAPRLWERIEQGDEDLAKELAQGVLVSQIGFVVEALDFLGIEHDGNGFFDKDAKVDEKLIEGWQSRVLEQFRDSHPEALILLYVNHLEWEQGDKSEVFLGAAASV